MAKFNPAFSGIKTDVAIENAATRKGIALKTGLLLLLAVLSGVIFVSLATKGTFGDSIIVIVFGALIIDLIAGILGQLIPAIAMVCSLIYSVSEGILLGLISYAFEFEYNGIVLSAVLITVTIFAVMLLLYSTGIVKVNNTFLTVMAVGFFSIILFSLIVFISSLINPENMLIYALTHFRWLMIGISVFIIIYGAFMLTVDFHRIDTLVAGGFDKRYEWTAALGLMITIVWIYIEVLRLLAILMEKNN